MRLLAQLNAITPLVEAAPAVRLSGRPLPAEIPTAVRRLADAVERGHSGPLELSGPRQPGSGIGRAVDQALRHAADVVTETSPDALRKAGDRVGRPAPLGVRAVRTARNVVLSDASWRYGLRLAPCIGLAQALVSLVPVPRSYWVALTITFVLKPDFGSVFSRALLRALGTVVGLVVAAGVLTEVPRGWWDVPVMLLLAPLIPVFTPRGYGYRTAAITPVILLLSDILNHQGTGLLLPRLLDSLMGCAIALVAGCLLWPESWHARVGDRLADAVADTAAYVEGAFGQSPADPAGRARMRRRLYRDLSAIRTEFQRALTEPPPIGRRAAAWWPLVVAVWGSPQALQALGEDRRRDYGRAGADQTGRGTARRRRGRTSRAAATGVGAGAAGDRCPLRGPLRPRRDAGKRAGAAVPGGGGGPGDHLTPLSAARPGQPGTRRRIVTSSPRG